MKNNPARVMEETETLRLSNQAFDAFWNACEDAPAPNAALQAAHRRRQKRAENAVAAGMTPDKLTELLEEKS